MQATILTSLPNCKYFFGTSDPAGLNWWKSEPLPGAIEEILGALWVYANYSIAYARMTDGTYSVFQTDDHGVTWQSVLNTAERIYTAFCPDYGIAIIATSGGWWRSTNSGSTWVKISRFAPNCFHVREVATGVFLALDGTSLWRSTDEAVSWTNIRAVAATGPVVDGKLGFCMLARGSKISISNNGGLTWIDYYGLDTWNENHHHGQVNWRHEVPIGIYCTGVGASNTPGDITWIIQSHDVQNNVVYHYWYKDDRSVVTYPSFYNKFTSEYSVGMHLDSHDVLRTGTSTVDQMMSFSGSTYDAILGKYVPYIMFSYDGGITWQQKNNADIQIYDSTALDNEITSQSNAFLEEDLSMFSWVGSICHNRGKWIGSNKMRRGQSVDIDLLVLWREALAMTKTLPAACYLSKTKTKAITSDVLLKAQNFRYPEMDIAILNTVVTPLAISANLQALVTKSGSFDVCNAARTPKTCLFDVLNQKQLIAPLIPRCYIIASPDKGLAMDIRLVDTHTDEIMNSIEKYTLQSPDIRYPRLPYNPYDSRKQTIT